MITPNASEATHHYDVDSTRTIHNLLPFDGIAVYYPGYVGSQRASELFDHLRSELHWAHECAHLFGRTVPLPRLTSWHGPIPYAYSGVVHAPRSLTPSLEELQQEIEPIAQGMNCVLANFYRDGKDSMSWHADDEPIWGSSPTICSVSFGATRRFVLKHKKTAHKVTIELNHGDVLVMAGKSQESWLHAIPKTKRPVDRRINLTFRRHF